MCVCGGGGGGGGQPTDFMLDHIGHCYDAELIIKAIILHKSVFCILSMVNDITLQPRIYMSPK